MNKIYLAGPCDSENRAIMKSIASIIRAHGKEVYCPWELKIENAWDYSQEDWSKLVFKADVQAIQNCDTMIVISMGRNSTAGTNWEQGFAFALHIPIAVFQITTTTTSLMTFCGCNCFINSSYNTIVADVKNVLENGFGNNDKCLTVLT